MSPTLNLAEYLLTKGRNFQHIGRDRDAFRIFDRLTGIRNLAPQINEATLTHLAEILLSEGRYVKARRYLTALLVQCPDNARYHYMMATALDNDERADPHRAADYYRKSLKLDPHQPQCLGEYGLLALWLGQTEEGLASLRRAVEIAPNDCESARRLVEGLWQESRDDEAWDALRAARFRNPRDRRFQQLWNDLQFRALHKTQRQRSENETTDDEMTRPCLLPFARSTTRSVGDKEVRLDPPSVPQPPHQTRRGRVPGKKQA